MSRMDWRSSYNTDPNDGYRLTIAREKEQGYRFVEMYELSLAHEYKKAISIRNASFYPDYVSKYKAGKSDAQYMCWNEKLAEYGRIVFDFDFKDDEDAYQHLIAQYPLDDRYEPIGFIDDMQCIIKQAFINLGKRDIANILSEKYIRWTTLGWDTGKYSPWCWSSACRPGKVSYHLTLPIMAIALRKRPLARYEEGLVDPWITDTRVKGVLRTGMTALYDEIQDIAEGRYRWLKAPIMDRALLNKNQCLRLPGFKKFKHLGTNIGMLTPKADHKPIHFISCVNPGFVPNELQWSIHEYMIKELEDDRQDISLDVVEADVIDSDCDSLWEVLQADCLSITSSYSGLQMVRDGTRHVFRLVRKHPQAICCVCNRVHNRVHDPSFITKFHGGYYLNCWRWHQVTKHKENAESLPGPRKIGFYRDDDEDEDNKQRWVEAIIDHAVDCYTNTEHRASLLPDDLIKRVHEQDLLSVPEYGDTYICSAMGTGKTKGVFQQLKERWPTFMAVTMRIIQAEKFHRELPGSTLYGNEYGWTTADRLVVQLESLHKVQTIPEVLVLDEIESILRLLLSDTLTGKEVQTITKLMELIKGCDRLIVMDAFLKQDTIKLLMKWRRKHWHRVPPTILVNTYKQIERSGNRHVLMAKNKKEWVGRLSSDTGHKVVVSASKKMAMDIAGMLEDKGESCLLITGDSPERIKRMDPREWSGYHNIVYTPALANSISFEGRHFDTMYVYVCKGSCSPEDMIQMMGRIRALGNDKVYMLINGGGSPTLEYRPLTKKQVYRDMKEATRAFKDKRYQPVGMEIWGTLRGKVQDLIARLYRDRGLGQFAIREVLIHIMTKQMGWAVDNDTYHHEEELKPVSGPVDEVDKEVFNTYTDDNTHYKGTWCKPGGKLAIRNLAKIRRGNKELPYGKETEMKDQLKEILELGGIDLDTMEEEYPDLIPEDMVMELRYKASDSRSLHPMITRMAMWYSTVPTRYKWKWLGKFLEEYMLLDVEMETVGANSKNREYVYKIDFSEWLYWGIKVRYDAHVKIWNDLVDKQG